MIELCTRCKKRIEVSMSSPRPWLCQHCKAREEEDSTLLPGFEPFTPGNFVDVVVDTSSPDTSSSDVSSDVGGGDYSGGGGDFSGGGASGDF